MANPLINSGDAVLVVYISNRLYIHAVPSRITWRDL